MRGALEAGAAHADGGGSGKHEKLLRKLDTLEASHRALMAGERCKVRFLQTAPVPICADHLSCPTNCQRRRRPCPQALQPNYGKA